MAAASRKECSILKTRKDILLYFLSILFWLVLWQVTAIKLDKELFLPTPSQVILVFWKNLLFSKNFWTSVLSSFFHIGIGFLSGFVCGVFLAICSYLYKPVHILLWFPIKIIKAVPVASFVILALLWMKSSNLAIFIPFLMVLPILYLHTLTALGQIDPKLIEMTKLFHVSIKNQILFLYLPQTLPSILSACSLAAGMAWKSGIAAEIIGLSKHSIGNQIYQAKIYLVTPELFAWSFVVILFSIGWEQFFYQIGKILLKETREK